MGETYEFTYLANVEFAAGNTLEYLAQVQGAVARIAEAAQVNPGGLEAYTGAMAALRDIVASVVTGLREMSAVVPEGLAALGTSEGVVRGAVPLVTGENATPIGAPTQALIESTAATSTYAFPPSAAALYGRPQPTPETQAITDRQGGLFLPITVPPLLSSARAANAEGQYYLPGLEPPGGYAQQTLFDERAPLGPTGPSPVSILEGFQTYPAEVVAKLQGLQADAVTRAQSALATRGLGDSGLGLPEGALYKAGELGPGSAASPALSETQSASLYGAGNVALKKRAELINAGNQQEQLAANYTTEQTQYIADGTAAAQRLAQIRNAQAQLAAAALPLGEEDAALIASGSAAAAKTAALQSARAAVAQQQLDYSLEEVGIIADGLVAQKQVAVASKEFAASIEKQAYESGAFATDLNPSGKGTGFQEFLARARSRTGGGFVNPLDQPTGTQFLEQRAASTAAFGVSAIGTFAAFSIFQKMLTDGQTIEKEFQQIRAEFDALGESSGLHSFEDGILKISDSTGEAATQVAQLALQFKGVYQGQSNTQILSQVQSAVELSKVTGVSLTDISNSLVAASVDFGTSMSHLGDVVLTMRDRTGVSAGEIIGALGSLSVAAANAGATVEQAAALAAVGAEKTGQSGSAVAEGLNRILPALQSKAGDLLTLFRTALPGETTGLVQNLAAGNTFAIFDQIGKNYDSLSKAQQNFVASLLGSRRDAKTAIDIWQSYAQVQADAAAAQNSNGRLTQSYADLQGTLAQQIQKVEQAFKNVGAVLLQLGVSQAGQEIAKVLGLLVGSVGEFTILLGDLNNLLGGVPGKLLGMAAAILILTKAFEALKVASILPGLGSILLNGRSGGGVVTTEGGPGAAGIVRGTPGPEFFPISGSPGPEFGGTASLDAAETEVKGGLRGFFQTVSTEAGTDASLMTEAGVAIRTAGDGLANAVGGFIAANPLLLLVVAVLAFVDAFQAVEDKVNQIKQAGVTFQDALSQTSTADLAAGKVDQKAIDAYTGAFKVPSNAKILSDITTPGNPLRIVHDSLTRVVGDIEKGGFFGLGQAPSAAEQEQNELRKRYTTAYADAFQQIIPKGEQQDLAKQFGLSEKDISKVAADAGTSSKSFYEKIQKLFETDTKNKAALTKAQKDILDGINAVAVGKAGALPQTLDVEEYQLETQQVTPEEFVAQAKQQADFLQKAVDYAVSHGSDQTTITQLIQEHDKALQAEQKYAKQQSDDLVKIRTAIASSSGGTKVQIDQATIAANEAALQTPGLAPTDILATALTIQSAEQQLVTDQADQATTLLQAQKILDQGITLPEGVVRALQTGFLQTGLSQSEIQAIQAATSVLGIKYKTIIDELIANKAGFEQAVLDMIHTIEDNAANLIREGKSSQADQALKDLGSLRSLVTQLKTFDKSFGNPAAVTGEQLRSSYDSYLSSTAGANQYLKAQIDYNTAQSNYNDAAAAYQAAVASGKGVRAAFVKMTDAATKMNDAETAYASQQANLASANAALAVAQAGTDPYNRAAAEIGAAQVALNNAIATGDPAQIAQAQAGLIDAQNNFKQQQVALVTAEGAVLTAEANNDPVKAAQAAIATANAQAAIASGPIERLQALAAQITAQHQLADAITAIADAQYQLVETILKNSGDVVKSAQESVKQAEYDYQRFVALGGNPKSAQGLTLQSKVSDAIAQARDTALTQALDGIQFLLDTNKIGDAAAIARLKVLDANVKLTTAQHHQIEEQIYQLEHALAQDLQFNLPNDIQLPTLYEARRFNEAGGGANYDNRTYSIIINTNAKLDGKDVQRLASIVGQQIGAPPRFGTRPRTY